MRNPRHLFLAAVLAAAGALLPAPAAAQDAAAREAKARGYFSDTVLQAQDGRALRFFSDVLKDRVVLVNFVFTECGDSCPLITHKLLQARQALGAQARDVRFVSITIDPERETPQTMAAFARKHGAVDPDWLWLSGSKANIEFVTKRLGAHTDTREAHFTGLIVGNLRTDRWIKIRPDAPPAVIAEELRRVGEFAAQHGAAATGPVALGAGRPRAP
jgi:cytochrome oxidase Cu insertion factor (SCO1/SenC/PrrC family)